MASYTVSVSNRYGVDKEYIAFHNIHVDADSDAEACERALLRFPACWHVEVNSVKKHITFW